MCLLQGAGQAESQVWSWKCWTGKLSYLESTLRRRASLSPSPCCALSSSEPGSSPHRFMPSLAWEDWWPFVSLALIFAQGFVSLSREMGALKGFGSMLGVGDVQVLCCVDCVPVVQFFETSPCLLHFLFHSWWSHVLLVLKASCGWFMVYLPWPAVPMRPGLELV